MSENNSVDRKKQLKRMLKNLDSAKTEDDEMEQLEKATKCLEMANSMTREGSVYDRIKNPREMVLDSDLVRVTSVMAGDEEKEYFSNEIIAESFMSKVKADDGALDWSRLEEPVLAMVRGFRVKRSLLGAIQRGMEQSQQKDRKRRQTTVPGAEAKPTEVVGPSQNVDGITRLETVVAELKEILDKRPDKRIPYWELITHPTSLWHTIDNALQMSHIARERVICFEQDDKGENWVRMITDEERQGEPNEMEAFIVSVDMAIQQEKVQRYNITKPMLYHNIGPGDEQF